MHVDASASLASGNLTKENIKVSQEALKAYIQLALPYSSKKATITKELTKDNVAKWKATLAAYKKETN